MNTKTTILVIDDDADICELISDYLTRNNYCVLSAQDGNGMREQLKLKDIDLVVLDVMLPGEDGLQLCRYLTTNHNCPILMLSALGDATDRIVGLEMGADDYLAKPFNPRELLARIKALLRHREKTIKSHHNNTNLQLYAFDRWQVDPNKRTLINSQGVHITLTSGEYHLLEAMLKQPHTILSRDQLLETTHGREAGPYDRTIDVQIARLRKKLECDPKNPTVIQTIRGGGYQLCRDVRKVIKK